MATQDDSEATTESAPSPLPVFKTPRGITGADRAVSELAFGESIVRLLTHERDTKLEALNAEIARINADYEETVGPIVVELKQRMKALRHWYRRNLRRYGEGRSIKLPSGIIGMQLDSNWVVEVVGDEEEAIKQTRRRGLKYVKIKVTLNRTAISRDRRRFRKVKSLRIHRQDRFFVSPTVLRDSQPPKPDRLRVAVEDLTNE
jgi:phage host-nuclease inhibitor protein Gam